MNCDEYNSLFPALRVVQLDANILDSTLITLFQQQLDQIGANIFHASAEWQLRCQHLSVSFPLFYFLPQIFTGQSPGQRLMDIHFGRGFSVLKGALNFLLNRGLAVGAELTKILSINRNVLKWAERLETALQLTQLLYFFYFLNKGGPSRLSEKLARLEPVYNRRPTLGQLNYANLQRELLGHSLAQLIIVLTPLFILLKRQLAKKLEKKEQNSSKVDFQKPKARPLLKCAECAQVAFCAVRVPTVDTERWTVFCHFCYSQHPRTNNDDIMKMLDFTCARTK